MLAAAAAVCGAVDNALLEQFQGSKFDTDAENGSVTIELPGGVRTVRKFARVWGCVVLAGFVGLVCFYHTNPTMETVTEISGIYAAGCSSIGLFSGLSGYSSGGQDDDAHVVAPTLKPGDGKTGRTAAMRASAELHGCPGRLMRTSAGLHGCSHARVRAAHQDLLRAAQRVVVLATGAATEAVRTIPRDGLDMVQWRSGPCARRHARVL